jgi:uncharacterized protein (TIGR02001 family)
VGPGTRFRIGILCIGIASATCAPGSAWAITFDGDLTYTSDYIFRGISQTGGGSAGQIDLRVTTRDGTFAGVFASTLNRLWHRGNWVTWGWDYQLEEYLGHRFDLSPAWSTTLTAVNYGYLKGNVPLSDDYQEVSVAMSYLDLWTASVSVIPNAVRFDGGYRLGRYPAYIADTSAQLPLVGRLFFTAGAGYYTSDETGYAFGNAGLAFEFKSLRVEAGYYFAQQSARMLFPYGRAGNRFAGTLSWHF